MKREDDEKLWDLLGRSAEPQASPFFARNVLRKIREAQGEPAPRRWWSLSWLVPAAGVSVAVIAALFLRMQLPNSTHLNSRGDTSAVSEAQDSELMADLDDLMGSDDTSLEDGVL